MEFEVGARDGTRLRGRLDDGDRGRAWVVAVHGVGEHMGRHAHLHGTLGGRAPVVRLDLRGHGLSGGPPADAPGFRLLLDDLDDALLHLRRELGMGAWSLFGHSMGALVACAWLQRRMGREGGPVRAARAPSAPPPSRTFLSAPPVGVPGLLGRVAGALPPWMLRGIGRLLSPARAAGLVDLGNLSHDPSVEARYRADPLCHTRLGLSLLCGLVAASRETFSRPVPAPGPSFAAWGGGDTIIDTASARRCFGAGGAGSGFVAREFPGAFHEMHHETPPHREPYLAFLKESLAPDG